MQRDDSALRSAMVESQLRARGIRDRRVLDAMSRVPRELFVPDEMRHEAYADGALPIDCGQTISQPIIVALMSEALECQGQERILEIGTGSGYQAAILAEIGGEVYSIERHPELTQRAHEILQRLGYRTIHLRTGDGALGWPEQAPFDRIIVTAAALKCPPALWDQLVEGGILVGPFGPPSEQSLYASHKVKGRAQSHVLTGCRFVPLISGSEKQDD